MRNGETRRILRILNWCWCELAVLSSIQNYSKINYTKFVRSSIVLEKFWICCIGAILLPYACQVGDLPKLHLRRHCVRTVFLR